MSKQNLKRIFPFLTETDINTLIEEIGDEQYQLINNFKFEIFDAIFVSFIERYPLNIIEKWDLSIKQKRKYKYNGVSYNTKIFLIEDDDGKWLNIKLNNDGFYYGRAEYRKQNISRHNDNKWCLLTYNYYKFFKKILELFPSERYKIAIFYNVRRKRVDIKIKSINNKQHYIITYEPGLNEYEEADDDYI